MSLLVKLWTSDTVHHENYLYNSLNLDYIYIYIYIEREREREVINNYIFELTYVRAKPASTH